VSLTTVVHDLARLMACATERDGADDVDDLPDALAVHVRRLAAVQADLAAVISPPTPLPLHPFSRRCSRPSCRTWATGGRYFGTVAQRRLDVRPVMRPVIRPVR
jgi:hypothetical protein